MTRRITKITTAPGMSAEQRARHEAHAARFGKNSVSYHLQSALEWAGGGQHDPQESLISVRRRGLGRVALSGLVGLAGLSAATGLYFKAASEQEKTRQSYVAPLEHFVNDGVLEEGMTALSPKKSYSSPTAFARVIARQGIDNQDMQHLIAIINAQADSSVDGQLDPGVVATEPFVLPLDDLASGKKLSTYTVSLQPATDNTR